MAKPNLTSYFHGTLEAIIHKAAPFSSCLFFSSFHHPAFVSIHIDNITVAETTRSRGREWNQRFRIFCAHSAGAVVTVVLRTPLLVLAKVRILASELMDGEEGWKDFKGSGKVARLEFSMRFCAKDGRMDKVVASFPERGNCGVLLYQDADHGEGFRPPVRDCKPRRLWEDLFRVIDGAEKLVCIAGWSLNPKLALVRDPHSSIPEAIGIELGALLKRKADEGVAVRILLWDDETSLPFIKNRGIMHTHDEDAFSFFHHTNVICRLCPRLTHHHLPSFFTHHQKTITADASPLLLRSLGLSTVTTPSPHRELLSFLGGLDLCDGRYDNEQHSLFRRLDADDFYQASIAGAGIGRGGPRQPWHDAHACVAGAAARDVLTNFEQCWAKHCGSAGGARAAFPFQTAVDGNWSVQVFRSIDRISVDGLPENLGTSEHSIHDAYVSAIRRAERFVYIENQYFMGGCHLWDEDEGSGCVNLIPVELALKVGDKIRAGERFAAYVVVPMWPEGSVDGEAVLGMLHWSRMTMAMMYRLVGKAIRESGVRAHPRDYLNFFCLANREERREGECVPHRFSPPPCGSHYWKAQKNRRFMIYVHSKLMIVDDEYILIGSANLNQRSMDGGRDTEIAIRCYQPNCINGAGGGDISAYRMSLWCEHTGEIDQAAFSAPESLRCVNALRGIGDEMWKKYSGEDLVDMEGVHLVSYPVDVLEDGSVEDLEGGRGVFPDTSALVRGRRSKILPPVFTT